MKRLNRQALKTLFSLTALTIVCGFLVRTITNSETLSDYAAKNHELAYGDTVENIDNKNEIETDEEGKAETDEKDEVETDEKDEAETDTGAITTETANMDTISPDRIIYQEGFYYEPLSDEIKAAITGISYPVTEAEASSLAILSPNTLKNGQSPVISFDNLRYLSVLYYDFNGSVQTGEIICNEGIVEDLAEIFYELYLSAYQIEKIRLIDEYQGDDEASMEDNNTSCFNYRVVPNTNTLSKHALGCAIDINPFYNPYVVINQTEETTTISPAGSEAYVNRSVPFEHKIDENDLCYKLFKEHGFEWGGDWKKNKDYQHFQKVVK